MSENYLGCSTSQIITPNNPKWKRNLKWISRPIKLRSSTPACKIFPYQFSISIKFNHAAQQILHCSIKNITWKISKSTTIFKISVHILQKFSAHTVYVKLWLLHAVLLIYVTYALIERGNVIRNMFRKWHSAKVFFLFSFPN